MSLANSMVDVLIGGLGKFLMFVLMWYELIDPVLEVFTIKLIKVEKMNRIHRLV